LDIDPLTFHYHVHSALDIIEERINPSKRLLSSSTSQSQLAPSGSSTFLSSSLTSSSLATPTHPPSNPQSDLYLGCLFSIEEYRIFGYITNTKIKFVTILYDAQREISLNSVSAYYKP
jgi:hypothetical protein